MDTTVIAAVRTIIRIPDRFMPPADHTRSAGFHLFVRSDKTMGKGPIRYRASGEPGPGVSGRLGGEPVARYIGYGEDEIRNTAPIYGP